MRGQAHRVLHGATRTLLLCLLLPGAVAQGQTATLHLGDSLAAQFGEAVAVDGPFLVVGAPGDDGAARDAGAAYVYRRSRDGWTRERRLLPPDASGPGIGFGRTLAFGDGILLVASQRRIGPRPGAGTVHVYDLDDGGVSPVATLQPSDLPIAAGFGYSIAIFETTAVIGAPGGHGEVDRSGVAYVYESVEAGWRLRARLAAPDGAPGDRFGAAVGLSSGALVVGAPRHGAGGSAYVFRRRAGDEWSPTTRLASPLQATDAGFGQSVAVDSDRLAVGAPWRHRDVPVGGGGPGAAVLYARDDDGGWRETRRLGAPSPSPGDEFGAALALGDDLLVVGAPGSDAVGSDAGAVHLYELADGVSPVHRGRLAWPTLLGEDRLGASLALVGDELVAGAPRSFGRGGTVLAYGLATVLRSDRSVFDLVGHPTLGLSSKAVNALAVDAEGYLLLGTLGGGLDVFDGRRFRSHVTTPGDPRSLSNDHVLALLVDGAGRTWLGTEDGLNRFDRRSAEFRRYRLGTSSEHTTEPVVALFEDRDGGVWTGTNGRLYRYDPDADRFAEYEPFTGPPERLDETYVSGIQQDGEGTLWVLAKNLWENRASLYRVEPGDGRIERFTVDPEWGQVGPLLVDSRDRIWIKGPAPARLAPDGTVRAVEPPLEASHWAFLEDRGGAVWIGTLTGLYRVGPGATTATRQTIVPGARKQGSWNWARSLAEAPDGSLLVGTDEGAFRLVGSGDPPAVPRLVVSRVEVTGRGSRRTVRPRPDEVLELSHEDYGLSFEFAALDYARSGRYRYRYRLRGFDRGWVDADGRLVAGYTNVQPGDYVFQVRAVAADGAPEPAPVNLSVVIRPPFWGTWWFRSMALVTLLALVGALVAYHRGRRRAVERMRSRIAGDLHDDLSTNLSGIALLGERVRRKAALEPTETRQLHRIVETSREMLGDLRDLVWLVDPEHDEVRDLVLKMRDVAETLLPADAWSFEADAPAARHLDMERRRELLRIYKEILHNAHRHADAGHVEIRVRTGNDRFHLDVEDDGVGFDPFVETQGQGLRSIRARAARLDATLEIDAEPGRGTRVSLRMPLD